MRNSNLKIRKQLELNKDAYFIADAKLWKKIKSKKSMQATYTHENLPSSPSRDGST